MSKNSNISSTPAGKNSGGGNCLNLSPPDRAIAQALLDAGFSFEGRVDRCGGFLPIREIGDWAIGTPQYDRQYENIDVVFCGIDLFSKPIEFDYRIFDREFQAAEKIIRDHLAEKYFSPGALVSFAIASVLPSLAAKIREVE